MTRETAESSVPDGMMEVLVDGKPALRRIEHYAPMVDDFASRLDRPGPKHRQLNVAWPVLQEDERLDWTIGGSAHITTGVY